MPILKGHPIAPAAPAILGHIVHAAPASISQAAYAAARQACAAYAHAQPALVSHYAKAHAMLTFHRTIHPAPAGKRKPPAHYVPAPGAIVAGAHQKAGLPVYYGALVGVLAGVNAFAPSGVLMALVVPPSGPAQFAPLGQLRLARLA